MRTALIAVLFASVVVSAAPQEEMDLQEILILFETGTSEDELIREIKRCGIKFRVDAEAEKQLQRKGVSDRLIHVLRQVELVGDVVRMKNAGKNDLEIIRAIVDSGVVLALAAEEKRMLVRKGISADVLDALQGNFTFREFQTHEHPAGYFRIQHPAGWNKIEEYEDDKIIVAFTPLDVRTARGLSLGFRVEIAVHGHRSPHTRMALEVVNRNRMRALAAEMRERGEPIDVRGEPRRVRVLGTHGILNEYEWKKGSAAIRRHAVLLFHNGVEYWIAYDAPAASFEEPRPTFEKMLLTFNPAPTEIGRQIRKPTADPQAILDKYRASIVRVECLWSQGGQIVAGGVGTGWFIRRDGYLLTNHHVVWHEELRKYPDVINLHWEVSLNRPSMSAKLIDAVRSDFPHVDIALLKAKGSDFEPLPVQRVNPPGKHIKEQDRVLVLGYPGVVESGREHMPLTLTTTLGNIIKFDLRPDRTINDVIHDCVTAGGNSGGPCFDLETHSVIGLHTYVKNEGRAATAYKGVVPVDTVFEYFPEIISYPESVEAKFRAEDYLALAVQYYNQGLYKPAARQLDKALAKRPQFPEAFAVAGDVLIAQGQPEKARMFYEKALAASPKNVRALMGLADLVPDRAYELLSEVIRLRPKDYRGYLARAELLLKLNRLEEAVRDARTCCECCADLHSDPYCQLGDLLYRQKKWEEGRRMFQKACEIDPRDAEARFGLVDFHSLQGRSEEARRLIASMEPEMHDDEEFQKIAGDYVYSLAGTHEKNGRQADAAACFSEAFGYYGRLIQIFESWATVPDSMTIMKYAWLANNKMRQYDPALKWYMQLTRMMVTVRDGKRVNDANLQHVYGGAAYACRNLKAEWLAGALFQACVDLGADTTDGKWATGELAREQRIPLTQEHVAILLTKTDFSQFAVLDMIRGSPIGWKLTPQEAEVLASKGWPVPVLLAVLEKMQGGVKGRDALIADWVKKDQALVAEARRIRYEDRNKLFEQWFAAHDRKDFRSSVPGFKSIFYRFYQEDRALANVAAYNACCGYSLSGLIEEAVDWFEICFYFGFFESEKDQVAHVNKDTDLNPIRHHSRFKAVLEAAKKIRGSGSTTPATTGKGALGVTLQNLSDRERPNLGLNPGVGVLITKVGAGSAAEKAGLVAGDVLCKLDNDVIGDSNKAIEWLGKRSPGTKITVVYCRNREYWKVEVVLGRSQ